VQLLQDENNKLHAKGDQPDTLDLQQKWKVETTIIRKLGTDHKGNQQNVA